jgi:hypothetical protein
MDERAIARGMRPNRHPLDEDSASRMLQGLVQPDDAPPGFASVAGLLASATHLPAADEEAGAATVSAMVEAIRGTAPTPEPLRRRPMIGKLFAGKALAALATVALTATGAAAATGTLPTPVQGAVAGAVSHIGIDLPDEKDDAPAAGDSPTGTTAGDDNDDSTTSTTGTTAADANKGQVISGITHDPALDGQPKGPTVCEAASEDRCRAGEDNGNRGKGHDDDSTGASTTSTTVTTGPTTSTTSDDHAGDDSDNRGSSNRDKSSGKSNSGKGKSGS